MSTLTTNFGFTKPGVNDPIDSNQWGGQLNTDLDTLDSLLKKLSVTGIGSTRPSYADAGTLWVNNSTNPWVLYIYDGTNDIQIGTIDTTTGQFNPNGASGINSVVKSTDKIYTINAPIVQDPELSFTLFANKKYIVKSFIIANRATAWPFTTSGNLPAIFYYFIGNNTYNNTTNYYIGSRSQNNTDISVFRIINFTSGGTQISYSSCSFFSSTNAAAGDVYLTSEARVVTGASDTIYTGGSNLTSSVGSGTYTIKAGSYVTYQEIN